MRELTLRSLWHGAALGNEGDGAAAAILAAQIETPSFDTPLARGAAVTFAAAKRMDIQPSLTGPGHLRAAGQPANRHAELPCRELHTTSTDSAGMPGYP